MSFKVVAKAKKGKAHPGEYFRILQRSTAKNSRARAGELETRHGVVETPYFMPIATRAAVKHLDSETLRRIGFNLILSNVYHLYQRPGKDFIQDQNLHKFMNWDGAFLTDSGGFQIFSLSKLRKLTEDGVEFTSEIDGRKIYLTPEEVIRFQMMLHSDIQIILDECPPHTATKEQAIAALERTTRWAARAKKEFNKLVREEKKTQAQKQHSNILQNVRMSKNRKNNLRSLDRIEKPLLFGITQGSFIPALRTRSAREISNIGFDGYALGGFFVGEPETKTWSALKANVKALPPEAPRYLMGGAKPEQLVQAVKEGIDMFDCVIPTRNGRHGTAYVFKKNFRSLIAQGKPFYEILEIRREKHTKDFKPLDQSGSCVWECCTVTRAYIRHLFVTQESLGPRLLTLHNLNFYYTLVRTLRELIIAGRL